MTSVTIAPNQNARDLFKAAYENRYTWDSQFPGYRANLTIKQGDEVHHGQVQITADMTVEVTGFTDEKVQESAYTQLRDIVTHRKRGVFDQAHGKNTFSLGQQDDSGAIEILVQGDAMGSNYKIRGTTICQVSRVMGRMAFVIDTYEGIQTEDGYIATRYDAVFRNPQTDEVIRVLKFDDRYEKLGNYYLMTHQTIQAYENGQRTTTEFEFTDLALLPATVS